MNEDRAYELLMGVLEDTNEHTAVEDITDIALDGNILTGLVSWQRDEWGSQTFRIVELELAPEQYEALTVHTCKDGPPAPTPLMDDAGSTLVPIYGCDFCGFSGEVSIERIGDKVACRKCIALDPDIDVPCDCCGHPFRVLDDGGTFIADNETTVCERCWVNC